MKTIIDPGEQLTFTPIKKGIQRELERREGNKEFVYNLTPFVRVSCLQEVAYTDVDTGKGDSLRDTANSILVDSTSFNGFSFVFNSNFDESYGTVQKIGKTLDSEDILIKNPRRVPPPSLNQFTATVGEGSDYFTTAQLSFTCNSLQQLQFLTPFLFNPGNTIFIEFGHNSEAMKGISLFDINDADDLVKSVTVDPNCNATGDGGFIEKMTRRVFDSGGSYDFFYGIINNFNFTINDSLGYDCTVDMIAASKMKLKAPNTDDYNNSDETDRRSIATTLESKLRTFEDWLHQDQRIAARNGETNPKADIFSLRDSDTTTYVRLLKILQFLDGDYSNAFSSELIRRLDPIENQFRPDDLLRAGRPSDVRRRETAEHLAQTAKDAKQIDTVLGSVEVQTVRKANTNIGEPPIVSYSSDVLIFRERMWNPPIFYNKDLGTFSIEANAEDVRNQINFEKSNYFLLSPEFKVNNVGPSFIDRAFFAETEFGEQQIITKFETMRPYLVNIKDNDKLENLYNIYINFDQFKSIYKASEGKNIDILKKLQDIINNATNDHWDVQFVGDATQPENVNRNECEKNITGLVSLSSFELENKETYTFKADSKNSVFTSMDYGLGLEGLLGDQIYMNSINSSDGSADSQKLNLLLFANHEDNLQITDKRTRQIRIERESLPKSEDAPVSKGGQLNKGDSIELKANFLGGIIIRNEGNGVPSSTGTPLSDADDETPIVNTFTLLDDAIYPSSSFDPRKNTIVNLEGLIIPFEKDPNRNRGTGPGFRLGDAGLARYTRDQIKTALFDLYDMERIPLIFTPVKSAIEKLRANATNKNLKKEESRDADFIEGGINPLLESTLDIGLPGIGGINPLEFVKVSGIPDVYANRGNFVVMNVAHTITPTNWETQITTRFRPIYGNE